MVSMELCSRMKEEGIPSNDYARKEDNMLAEFSLSDRKWNPDTIEPRDE